MARITLKAFASQQGFVAPVVSKIRANASGYLFVTICDSFNPERVENIYFGKRFQNESGYKPTDTLRTSEVFVVDTINAAGETRRKLSDKEGDALETLKAMGYQEL